MRNTPRTDAVFHQFGPVAHPAAIAYFSLCRELERETNELKRLREENEVLNMQLAAVMTASVQNTETSIKDRIDRPHLCWSQAYADVCTAVDREMRLREINGELAKRNDILTEALGDIAGYRGEGPPSTPWRDIVRECGQTARAALSRHEARSLTETKEG